jgi:hypothetical protein
MFNFIMDMDRALHHKLFESQIIQKSLEAVKPKRQHWLWLPMPKEREH